MNENKFLYFVKAKILKRIYKFTQLIIFKFHKLQFRWQLGITAFLLFVMYINATQSSFYVINKYIPTLSQIYKSVLTSSPARQVSSILGINDGEIVSQVNAQGTTNDPFQIFRNKYQERVPANTDNREDGYDSGNYNFSTSTFNGVNGNITVQDLVMLGVGDGNEDGDNIDGGYTTNLEGIHTSDSNGTDPPIYVSKGILVMYHFDIGSKVGGIKAGIFSLDGNPRNTTWLDQEDYHTVIMSDPDNVFYKIGRFGLNAQVKLYNQKFYDANKAEVDSFFPNNSATNPFNLPQPTGTANPSTLTDAQRDALITFMNGRADAYVSYIRSGTTDDRVDLTNYNLRSGVPGHLISDTSTFTDMVSLDGLGYLDSDERSFGVGTVEINLVKMFGTAALTAGTSNIVLTIPTDITNIYTYTSDQIGQKFTQSLRYIGRGIDDFSIPRHQKADGTEVSCTSNDALNALTCQENGLKFTRKLLTDAMAPAVIWAFSGLSEPSFSIEFTPQRYPYCAYMGAALGSNIFGKNVPQEFFMEGSWFPPNSIIPAPRILVTDVKNINNNDDITTNDVSSLEIASSANDALTLGMVIINTDVTANLPTAMQSGINSPSEVLFNLTSLDISKPATSGLPAPANVETQYKHRPVFFNESQTNTGDYFGRVENRGVVNNTSVDPWSNSEEEVYTVANKPAYILTNTSTLNKTEFVNKSFYALNESFSDENRKLNVRWNNWLTTSYNAEGFYLDGIERYHPNDNSEISEVNNDIYYENTYNHLFKPSSDAAVVTNGKLSKGGWLIGDNKINPATVNDGSNPLRQNNSSYDYYQYAFHYWDFIQHLPLTNSSFIANPLATSEEFRLSLEFEMWNKPAYYQNRNGSELWSAPEMAANRCQIRFDHSVPTICGANLLKNGLKTEINIKETFSSDYKFDYYAFGYKPFAEPGWSPNAQTVAGQNRQTANFDNRHQIPVDTPLTLATGDTSQNITADPYQTFSKTTNYHPALKWKPYFQTVRDDLSRISNEYDIKGNLGYANRADLQPQISTNYDILTLVIESYNRSTEQWVDLEKTNISLLSTDPEDVNNGYVDPTPPTGTYTPSAGSEKLKPPVYIFVDPVRPQIVDYKLPNSYTYVTSENTVYRNTSVDGFGRPQFESTGVPKKPSWPNRKYEVNIDAEWLNSILQNSGVFGADSKIRFRVKNLASSVFEAIIAKADPIYKGQLTRDLINTFCNDTEIIRPSVAVDNKCYTDTSGTNNFYGLEQSYSITSSHFSFSRKKSIETVVSTEPLSSRKLLNSYPIDSVVPPNSSTNAAYSQRYEYDPSPGSNTISTPSPSLDSGEGEQIDSRRDSDYKIVNTLRYSNLGKTGAKNRVKAPGSFPNLFSGTGQKTYYYYFRIVNYDDANNPKNYTIPTSGLADGWAYYGSSSFNYFDTCLRTLEVTTMKGDYRTYGEQNDEFYFSGQSSSPNKSDFKATDPNYISDFTYESRFDGDFAASRKSRIPGMIYNPWSQDSITLDSAEDFFNKRYNPFVSWIQSVPTGRTEGVNDLCKINIKLDGVNTDLSTSHANYSRNFQTGNTLLSWDGNNPTCGDGVEITDDSIFIFDITGNGGNTFTIDTSGNEDMNAIFLVNLTTTGNLKVKDTNSNSKDNLRVYINHDNDFESNDRNIILTGAGSERNGLYITRDYLLASDENFSSTINLYGGVLAKKGIIMPNSFVTGSTYLTAYQGGDLTFMKIHYNPLILYDLVSKYLPVRSETESSSNKREIVGL